ncbi:MAG: hypothetical protein VST66_04065, partial [Nitrospirota bacterium]|nr:hypothetical protein [Nitrospirota bacterium]
TYDPFFLFPRSPLAHFPHSGTLFPFMASPGDPKEMVTLEELALSHTWEIAALVEGLERGSPGKHQTRMAS